MKHTKEPWIKKYDEICYKSDSDDQAFEMLVPIATVYDEANRDRIIDCINACSGLTNEQLESGYIQKLIQEREEAIKLAKEINEKLDKMLGVYKNEAI
jgi:hypothetical protein